MRWGSRAARGRLADGAERKASGRLADAAALRLSGDGCSCFVLAAGWGTTAPRLLSCVEVAPTRARLARSRTRLLPTPQPSGLAFGPRVPLPLRSLRRAPVVRPMLLSGLPNPRVRRCLRH